VVARLWRRRTDAVGADGRTVILLLILLRTETATAAAARSRAAGRCAAGRATSDVLHGGRAHTASVVLLLVRRLLRHKRLLTSTGSERSCCGCGRCLLLARLLFERHERLER
jgi:hypothetical protein